MKLFRFGELNNEKPGVFSGNEMLDATAFAEDYTEDFFAKDGLKRLDSFVKDRKGYLPKITDKPRIAAPVSKPSKIVCIGLNYADHAKETNAPYPSEPVIFLKSTTALCGPNDNIIIPQNSTKTDWEVELAVVIGKRASYIKENNAMDYIAGYLLHNDVSERAFQMERNGTWDKGKGCDTFAPIGPYLVTKDEIKNLDDLRLWLKVNDTIMQDGNTCNLIYKVPYLVSYVSQFMTLLPGDIISTGTPAGVGFGMKPPVYLKAGDVVELGIDNLGVARQNVVAYED